MVLPLEEVIFMYRLCQTWLLSCLRNHSKAQTGLPERASHDICRISLEQSTARVYLAGLFEEPTIHWLLSAVEMEVLCECLTFLTISVMIVCALGLAEECTFWRFSLKETHLELDTGFSFEACDVTCLWVPLNIYLSHDLFIYSWFNLKVCRPLFLKIIIYFKYKYIFMIYCLNLLWI